MNLLEISQGHVREQGFKTINDSTILGHLIFRGWLSRGMLADVLLTYVLYLFLVQLLVAKED